MESTKSKFKETTIKELKQTKELIAFKSLFYKQIECSKVMFKKTSREKHLTHYLLILNKLKSTEFNSLHDAIQSVIQDWIHETLDQDQTLLCELENKTSW